MSLPINPIQDGDTGELAAEKINAAFEEVNKLPAALARRAFAGGVELRENRLRLGDLGHAPTDGIMLGFWMREPTTAAGGATQGGVYFSLTDGSNLTPRVVLGRNTIGNDDIVFYVTEDDGNQINGSGGDDVHERDSEWHHYAITVTDSAIRCYVDSGLKREYTGSFTITQATRLVFGGYEHSTSARHEGPWQLRDPHVFNRALSDAEVTELYESGHVAVADRWGAPTPVLTQSDFGFSLVLRGTLDSDVDGFESLDDWVSFYANGDTGTHQIGNLALPVTFEAGVRYRVTAQVFIPSGQTNVDGLSFVLAGGGSPLSGSLSTNVTGVVTTMKWDIVPTSDSNDIRIYQQSGGGGSFTGANNPTDDLIYVRDIKVTRLGCLASLPMDEGIGRQFRDVSPNGYHGLLGETGFDHLLPASDASIDVSDVDAFSRVALLEDSDTIPENSVVYAASVRINDDWYDVDFDSAVAQDRTKRSIEVFATGAPETLYFYRGDDTSDFASVQIGTTTIDQIILHYRKAS